ncbi:MAG: hypothetical protein ACLVLP_11945 [Phascolarctobacterium faecium]
MEIITSFIFAFIATMAFAVLFQSPKKNLADRWFDWSCWLGGFL